MFINTRSCILRCTSRPFVIFAQAQLHACNRTPQRACLREDPYGEGKLLLVDQRDLPYYKCY